MFDAVVQTKLFIPAPPPACVVRQRLVNQLNQGGNHKLCLVSAPAGYGKTTLVAAWAQQSRRPAAWVSLGPGDNEPNRFLAYLITALHMVQPGHPTTANESHPQQIPVLDEALLTHLVNEIAGHTAAFSLILDDYHHITEPRIHAAVTFLLDNMLPNMHLIILTRQDPPLSIARLRARGQLVEMRQADLQFTQDQRYSRFCYANLIKHY